jgi:hypothetical protein
MTRLKLAFAFFCFLDVLAIFHIGQHNIAAPSPLVQVFGHYGDYVGILNATLFALAFCGIQLRLPMMWNFGWIVFGFMSVELVVGIYSSLSHQPRGWIGFAVAVAAFSIAGAYWGRWWLGQRSYFSIGTPL